MSSLILHLRKGEEFRANGVSIRFQTELRIELTAQTRFLFGRQIMPPDQAYSPARQIYYALQSAYIGSEDERCVALLSARQLVDAFDDPTPSGMVRKILDQVLSAAEADKYYQAIKLARRVISYEDSASGRSGQIR